MLRISWLVLGTAFVLVFGLALFTILVKGPNPPSTAPGEESIARHEKESPPPRTDDIMQHLPPSVDSKTAANDRDNEVHRVLGGGFRPSRGDDVVSLAEAPPPLPPPSAKTKEELPPPLIAPKGSEDSPSPAAKPVAANGNAAVEQRLQADEEDLRKQLLSVPELQLFSDLVVEDFRQREQNDERQVKGVPRDQIEYAYNVQFNKYMRQAGVKEGLPLLSGPNCQLDPSTASIVQTLSKQLRDMGFVSVPGAPVRARSANGSPKAKTEAFKEWCDLNQVEQFRGALATLLQMLQVEDVPTRLLLVRELAKVNTAAATAALAKRAMVDLSPEVRQAAVAALEKRPALQYVPVLLQGLRYPWAPVADHAALALRKLKAESALPRLVALLDQPDPARPVLDNRTKKPLVHELVRLNHMRNCLLCHAPSANSKDGLVRGLVPTPGQPLPRLYYASQTGNFVRADITFMRQDFSANLPVEVATLWPKDQRFDFVTRVRPAKPEEMPEVAAAKLGNYPQREAVLYALRGITAKDAGDSSIKWRKALGLAVQATEKTKDAPLDKAGKSTNDRNGELDKSETSRKVQKHKP